MQSLMLNHFDAFWAYELIASVILYLYDFFRVNCTQQEETLLELENVLLC